MGDFQLKHFLGLLLIRNKLWVSSFWSTKAKSVIWQYVVQPRNSFKHRMSTPVRNLKSCVKTDFTLDKCGKAALTFPTARDHCVQLPLLGFSPLNLANPPHDIGTYFGGTSADGSLSIDRMESYKKLQKEIRHFETKQNQLVMIEKKKMKKKGKQHQLGIINEKKRDGKTLKLNRYLFEVSKTNCTKIIKLKKKGLLDTMDIINFTADHIEQAAQIVKQNYLEECNHVSAFPEVEGFPDLISLAQNGLGVAAFENKNMLGFLSCYSPFQNAFGATDAVGVFSPIHGNGAVFENRTKIYAYMYQAAAKKWIEKGAISHAICLYAHNKMAHELFFQYGFGLRCMDAIRNMEEIEAQAINDIFFTELDKESFSLILPFNKLLTDHLKQSPTFYRYPVNDDSELLNRITADGNRYFIAKNYDNIVAYLKVAEEGENFISDNEHVINVCGAYCLPEYRGDGLFLNLLNFAIRTLKNEGYILLGVDFESFNPTAYGFWLKYFTAYTHSVVRRIDEYALK